METSTVERVKEHAITIKISAEEHRQFRIKAALAGQSMAAHLRLIIAREVATSDPA